MEQMGCPVCFGLTPLRRSQKPNVAVHVVQQLASGLEDSVENRRAAQGVDAVMHLVLGSTGPSWVQVQDGHLHLLQQLHIHSDRILHKEGWV